MQKYIRESAGLKIKRSIICSEFNIEKQKLNSFHEHRYFDYFENLLVKYQQ